MKITKLAVLISLSLPFSSFADRLIYPQKSIQVAFDSSTDIQDSLQKTFEELGIDQNADDFLLTEKKDSLTGAHYYFQQMINGHEVARAVFVVSVDKMGSISKVYNSSVNAPAATKMMATIPFLSEQRAIELAWNELQVNGELLEKPTARLTYTADLKLVYIVNLSTTSPFGHFEIIVNAQNGEVGSVTDAALPRMKRAEAPMRNKSKKLVSYSAAVKKLNEKSPLNFFEDSIELVSGSAQVFDPNPVVSLKRTDLTDVSDASEFLLAYKTEELKEISFSGGVYNLVGPKVTLLDFESPNIAPSTSTNGFWNFERKNVAFNDAMTYLHLDRSVRYIESLGFSGNKAIFKKSIEVDANGVGGSDNSHYVPSSRRLAFGHGCVDDNEDTDVILHELGHAIHHHINSSWYGGDTGAMGEGFGDYWAATYSATTENGLDFYPELVFKWDGHNECWAGRKLNAFEPTYNPMRTYSAHYRVDGGISDEIWSTPIFQTFLELYKRGVAREDIDKIILEAHFGLGSGVRMPEMAKAIVKTAKDLFPNEDYDQVYLKHFKIQKILQ